MDPLRGNAGIKLPFTRLVHKFGPCHGPSNVAETFLGRLQSQHQGRELRVMARMLRNLQPARGVLEQELGGQ